MLSIVAMTSAMLLAVACAGQRVGIDEFSQTVYSPRYALGFEIVGAEGRASTILLSHNPWQGAEDVQTALFIARDGEQPPAGFTGQVVSEGVERVVCMSSTHVALLDAVGAVESVVGVSGIDFVTNEYVVANRDKVRDVGYDNSVDYEMVVALDPDVVLLYGVTGASQMESKLRELGIPFAYIGEYVEEVPLGKTEWMVAIGEIVGRRAEAEQLFNQIPERYDALREMAASATTPKPKVMINTPYADSWFMASATSYVARLIADAGGDYLYKKNTSNTSLPIDLEEAALLASQADVWINAGSVATLEDMRAEYPKFADMRCVEQGHIFNFDRRMSPRGGNDYWESGVVRPDVVLRDLIKIFHPELMENEEFFYYRKLE
ncbi:MAG: ABC transporter substrate-binding protein [Alistipes sp.]|nr:ABC transporter substrate-binding protein [Alistipes sp.]